MRFLVLILTIAVTGLFNTTKAEGIEFFEGTWKEALAESERTSKLIFVDAYTTWCGPCKRMAAQIFPLKDVGDFYNANFINMKMDMEKGEGRTIRSKYNVNAFPTFLFVDAKGKLQFMSKGGKPADRFIQMGKTALTKVDYTGDYTDRYEEGERDPELLYNYAYALMKSNKPSLKVANEYLQTQDDKTTDKNLKFVMDLATESDSRIFTLFMANRAKIEAMRDGASVNDKIEAACKKTVDKAIEYQSADLLAEAKENMNQHYPAQAAAFSVESDMAFYKETNDQANYLKVCDKYLKKTAKNNAAAHNKIAKSLLSDFSEDSKVMAKAEAWAKKAAEFGGLSEYNMTYANILYANGKKQQALNAAKTAADLAKAENKKQGKITAFIKKIEAEL